MLSVRTRTATTGWIVIACAAATACSSNARASQPPTDRSTAFATTSTTTRQRVNPTPTIATPKAPNAPQPTTADAATPDERYSFSPNQPAPPLPLATEDPKTALLKLMRYQDWLYSHNPDPELVNNLYVANNPSWDDVRRDLTWLRDNDRRRFDVDGAYVIEKNEPVGSAPRFFVKNSISEARIVNHNGTTFEIWRTPKGGYFAAFMAQQKRNWQLVDITSIGDHPLNKERP